MQAFHVRLFEWMTLRLMAHKYLYYVLDTNIIDDYSYDRQEKDWHKFGQELGLLDADTHSPCVDFDFNHPLAEDAKKLAKAWLGKNLQVNADYLEITKRYGP